MKTSRIKGRFHAFIHGNPRGGGRTNWTFQVWDFATHRLAATDNTGSWAAMLAEAQKTIAELEAAVRRDYYTPPQWLKGAQCPCPVHDAPEAKPAPETVTVELPGALVRARNSEAWRAYGGSPDDNYPPRALAHALADAMDAGQVK